MPKGSNNHFDNPTTFFIGEVSESFPNGVLPNNRHILSVMFYYTRVCKYTLLASAREVSNKVLEIYSKARIPTLKIKFCMDKIAKLRRRYAKVSSNMHTRSQRQTDLERQFLSELEEMFEIAVTDDMIRDKKALKYLNEQRSKYTRPVSNKTVRFENSFDLEQSSPESEKRKKTDGIKTATKKKKKVRLTGKKPSKPKAKSKEVTGEEVEENGDNKNENFQNILPAENINNSPKKMVDDVENNVQEVEVQNGSLLRKSCIIS